MGIQRWESRCHIDSHSASKLWWKTLTLDFLCDTAHGQPDPKFSMSPDLECDDPRIIFCDYSIKGMLMKMRIKFTPSGPCVGQGSAKISKILAQERWTISMYSSFVTGFCEKWR